MIGDSASNGNAIAGLVLALIIGATLATIRGMKTLDRLITTAYDDDEQIRATVCDCDDCCAWYAYKPNAPQKAWWKP